MFRASLCGGSFATAVKVNIEHGVGMQAVGQSDGGGPLGAMEIVDGLCLSELVTFVSHGLHGVFEAVGRVGAHLSVDDCEGVYARVGVAGVQVVRF